uniref:Uncharacterized protein n=1 Tax=Timema monikensis TaxID=170555 RepID=A0A7R9E845_9NEOP|nr:unnamed protein product [Timema monikensis]
MSLSKARSLDSPGVENCREAKGRRFDCCGKQGQGSILTTCTKNVTCRTSVAGVEGAGGGRGAATLCSVAREINNGNAGCRQGDWQGGGAVTVSRTTWVPSRRSKRTLRLGLGLKGPCLIPTGVTLSLSVAPLVYFLPQYSSAYVPPPSPPPLTADPGKSASVDPRTVVRDTLRAHPLETMKVW